MFVVRSCHLHLGTHNKVFYCSDYILCMVVVIFIGHGIFSPINLKCHINDEAAMTLIFEAVANQLIVVYSYLLDI